MLKKFDLVIGNKADQHTLTYQILETKAAQTWASLMSKTTIKNLRPFKDPWDGRIKDPSLLVYELTEVVSRLNTWLPNKIDFKWDANDIQESVNKYHTHFPEHKDDTDPFHRKDLERYNDLLHELEDVNRRLNKTGEQLHLLICPQDQPNVPLEADDFKQFTWYRSFGDLYLGYDTIGRHPLELMWSKDVNCPKDQIIPFNCIGTIFYAWFGFTLPQGMDYILANRFKNFYYESGLEWPFKLEDPRMGLGYLILGNLQTVNGLKLQEEEIKTIVRSCNKILNWKIYN